MNIITNVRDTNGKMHALAFTPEEARRPRAYYVSKVESATGAERREMAEAIHSLDLVMNQEDAYADIYAPPSYSPAWEKTP